MIQVRCRSCTKLFHLANIFDGEIKCYRCGYKGHYTIVAQSAENKLYELLNLKKEDDSHKI